MQDLLKQLLELMPLAASATEGPWMLTTTNANPRGLRNYQQVVRATDTGILGGIPHPKTTMQLQFEAYGEIRLQSDGTPDGYWPTAETKANAAFIAAARNLLTPENLTLLVAALAAPVAAVPVAEDAMGARELVYFAHLESLAPAALLAEWEASEEASHVEAESYKPAYVRLLMRALRTATMEGSQPNA